MSDDLTPQERREQIMGLARGPKGDKGEQGEQLSRPLRRALVWLFLLAALMSVTSMFFAVYYVHSSQHQWCSTLTLLTSSPVPRPADPQANPSREQTYVLYSDFVQLRHRLGCG